MRSNLRLLVAAALTGGMLITGLAVAEDRAEQEGAESTPKQEAEPVTPEQEAAAAKAFADVAKVLQSPRCMNCHPAGDKPLQTDESKPHALGISRASEEAGLACTTCHQTTNADKVGTSYGPPGAPNWHLPPKDTPMVFQGLTATALCEQLKDPEQNGKKTLAELLHHVSEDPLVLWGWEPGGNRTKPPLDHKAFVAAFTTWVEGGGACPE